MTDNSAKSMSLPSPARYTPWLTQRDLLAPGLFRLGHDFGNAVADTQFFQFDKQFQHYRQNKLRNHSQPGYYYCKQGFNAATEQAVNNFIIDRLCGEHPGYFHRQQQQLHCELTGECLPLQEKPLATIDLFDALAMQVMEDIAVLQFDNNGNNHLCALHLDSPNHWAANQRIGEDFHALHKPVPGFNTQTDSQRLLSGLLDKGPYVRFVWGLTDNRQLNQHPQLDTPLSSSDSGKLFVRIERQVLQGLPAVNALLFLVRTYFTDIDTLSSSENRLLLEKIRSMEPAMKTYKGIDKLEKKLSTNP